MNYLKEIEIKNSENSANFPFNLPIFQQGVKIVLDKPVTFFVGRNGAGKSTLLENLAKSVGFNTLGGNSNHFYENVKLHDNLFLSKNMKLTWNTRTQEGFFFRAESFINFIEYVDKLAEDNGNYSFMPYGGKSLQKQSHGESFISLFENRFSKGLFILDEPESALSPQKQLELVYLLHELSKTGKCQFIITTHSPILITCPNSEIFEINDNKFVKTEYTETEQFQFYKSFVDCPDRYLNNLFENDYE